MKEQVFIYPTDTVWGIGCDVYNKELCHLIHKIKNSDSSKPMSILFKDHNQLEDFIPKSEMFNERFWELGVTVLFPIILLSRKIPEWITCNSKHVGIRVLKNRSIDLIMSEVDGPIISTSLNKSGEPVINELTKVHSFIKSLELPETEICKLINEDNVNEITGFSSTIIKLNENLKGYSIIREGKYLAEIKNEIRIQSA